MILEHLIYSAALAIVVGMIFLHYTGKDPSWLIVIMTIFPDVDYVLNVILRFVHSPIILYHGDFHNIVTLISVSLLVGAIATRFGFGFINGFVCSMIGVLAHYFEDFFVYPPMYALLYPFSKTEFGVNLIPETRNIFFGFMGTEVLSIGLVLLISAFCVKYYHNRNWTIMEYVNSWLHVGSRVKYYSEVLIFGALATFKRQE